MPAHDAVASVLVELGTALGTELALQDGALTLAFADEVACTLELPPDADRLYLHAPVARLPPGRGEPVLRAAMARNLFTLTPPGSCLALDPESDLLVLCATLPLADIAAEGLGEVLLAMGEEVRSLRSALAVPTGEGDLSLRELADEMRNRRMAPQARTPPAEAEIALPHGLSGIGMRG